jgi:hypothetical protein
MPMRDELQISDIDLSDRRTINGDAASCIIPTITSPEFGMVALFCAVGLWTTFYFLHFSSLLNAAGT